MQNDHEEQDFTRRREKLAQALRDHDVAKAAGGARCAIFFATPTATRNHDVEHRYRADADLAWLLGFYEPACVFVVRVDDDEVRTEIFLRPSDKKKEIWNGRRLGTERAVAALNVDAAFPIEKLEAELPRLLWNCGSVFSRIGRRRADDTRLLQALTTARSRTRRQGQVPEAVLNLAPVLGALRLQKDSAEIARMQQAAAASRLGHENAMAACRPGLSERELEAELTYHFLQGGGAGHAYGPIVAAGDNACILHYIENDAPIKDGDLVLIDAGAEVDCYASDVTRTFPANGKFNTPQRELYQIVLAANEAGIAAAKPGVTIQEIDDVARLVLAQGLVDLGLLQGDPEALVERVPEKDDPPWAPGKAALERFYMHGTSHYLGLDVHDAGRYHACGEPTPMSAGVAFTVEPGLYVAPDDEEAPKAFRGIGIRIEDDVVLTAAGQQVLSAAIPKSIAEIEALVGSRGP